MTEPDRARQRARAKFWRQHHKSRYECPDCGRSQAELRTGLEVHHKDGNPSNNELDNLVAVCRPCHNIREGKKPSLNEIELMRDQIESRKTSHVDPVCFGQNWDELNEHYRRCAESCIPAIRIKQINRRKYASLEIDFDTTKGWQRFVRMDEVDEHISYEDLPTREPYAQLTEPAVEKVNMIMKTYRDRENSQWQYCVDAPSTAYGASIIGYPPMRPSTCRQLADELKPIIMNEEYWEPSVQNEDYVPYEEFISQ